MVKKKKGRNVDSRKKKEIYNWVLDMVYNVFPQFSWIKTNAHIINICEREWSFTMKSLTFLVSI